MNVQQLRVAWLMRRWELDRDGLDEAAGVLGVPPLSDREWAAIEGAR